MISDASLWAVADAPVADVEEWAIVVCLSERADPDGEGCFLSYPSIARRTRMSVSTVKRRILTLESRRVIARGDQSLAAYIPEEYRPVVWDLMVPFSWFPNVDRIQDFRARQGRQPLTPAARPDIGEAPEKPRRADAGKPKPRKQGLVDTAQEDHGVVSPSADERCLVDTTPGSSSTTNLFPSQGDPEEKSEDRDVEVKQPELVLIEGGSLGYADAKAHAKQIVDSYLSWWKSERRVKVIPGSSRVFHALAGFGRSEKNASYVTEALLAGIHPDDIKRALWEHAKTNRGVLPTPDRWTEVIVRAQGGHTGVQQASSSTTDQRVMEWQALKDQGDDGPAAIGGAQ